MLAQRLTLLALFLSAAAILGATGCGGGSSESVPTANIGGENTSTPTNDPQRVERPVVLTSQESQSPSASVKSPAELKARVVIKTTLGDITIELDSEKAPVTVDNFLAGYVDRDFYSGTIFHHVDPTSLVAAGGFTEDLTAKPVRAHIRCEADNGLSNVRGTVTMAREPSYPDSATSQFMINLADNTYLDHQNDDDPEAFGYCVFGRVVEGMDVVDQIAATPAEANGDFPALPKTPVVIQSIERVE